MIGSEPRLEEWPSLAAQAEHKRTRGRAKLDQSTMATHRPLVIPRSPGHCYPALDVLVVAADASRSTLRTQAELG